MMCMMMMMSWLEMCGQVGRPSTNLQSITSRNHLIHEALSIYTLSRCVVYENSAHLYSYIHTIHLVLFGNGAAAEDEEIRTF